MNAPTGRTDDGGAERSNEVEDFFGDSGTRRALSRRRNRKQVDHRVGEREARARRNERLGSALEIGTSDMDHRGDPQKNALFSEPVSQTVQHGPERSRSGSFYRALAQNRVDPLFVEGHPAPVNHDEPPDLSRYLEW